MCRVAPCVTVRFRVFHLPSADAYALKTARLVSTTRVQITERAVGWERLYKRDIAQLGERRQGVGGRRFESYYPVTLTEVYLSKSITVDGQLKEIV